MARSGPSEHCIQREWRMRIGEGRAWNNTNLDHQPRYSTTQFCLLYLQEYFPKGCEGWKGRRNESALISRPSRRNIATKTFPTGTSSEIHWCKGAVPYWISRHSLPIDPFANARMSPVHVDSPRPPPPAAEYFLCGPPSIPPSLFFSWRRNLHSLPVGGGQAQWIQANT